LQFWCGQNVAGTKTGRLVALPVKTGNEIKDDQIQGDNIVDQHSLNWFGGGALLQEHYTGSDTIIFQKLFNKLTLQQGSDLSVQIIHTQS
jgi:hypothetical protein